MTFQAHYFLAVPIPQQLRTAVHQTINNGADKFHFQSSVLPEDYHITLFFLGAATQAQLAGITSSVSNLAAHFQPFMVKLDRFDFFGTKEQPRVFWAGIRPSMELNELQSQVAAICSQYGYIPEDRPYRPHITLARRWKGDHPFSLPSMALSEEETNCRVDEVILYQSHTKRTPKYEAINRFALAR